MKNVSALFVWITAGAHFLFAAIEMFPWKRPFVFNLVKLGFNPSLENEVTAAPIVHNAGLYNGFIAAGLIWSRCSIPEALHLSLFFLSCAVVAGVFGAFTLTAKTLFLQTLPAAVALIAILAAR
jgi:putative membrane protein